MSDSKVREQFEAWTIRAGGHPSVLRRNAQGDYALGSVRAEYAVWQASRADALEEAERACKRQRITGPGACSVEHSRMRHDHNSGVEKCESAIRALAGRGA